MDTLIRKNTWQPRFSAWLSFLFSYSRFAFRRVGIHQVVPYVTAARRRDYGIRLSRGATSNSLFQVVALESLVPVLLGIASGMLAAYGTNRWIASLLYKTGMFDLLLLLAAIPTFVLITLFRTFLPAQRTSQIDPATVLREG